MIIEKAVDFMWNNLVSYLFYGYLHDTALVVKLSSDVNVASPRPHGSSSDQSPFQEFVGVVSEDLPIFASSWFPFICVDYQVLRSATI